MAYTGLGAGTIGDPYQITTEAEFLQAKNGATEYFKLMNNITLTSNCYMYNFTAKLDGNNKTIDGVAGSQTSLFAMVNTATITNLTIKLKHEGIGSLQYIINSTAFTSGTISNIKVINTNTTKPICFFSTSVEPGITFNNITLEGNIYKVIQGDIKTPVSGIYINMSLNITLSSYLIADTISANVTNVQVTSVMCNVPSANYYTLNLYLFSTINNVTLSKCWWKTSFNGYNISLANNISGTSAKIEDCYFWGKSITISDLSSTPKQAFILKTSGYSSPYPIVTRCYSFIEELNYPIVDTIYSGSLFNDLGYTDWYIPSFAELALIKNLPYGSLTSPSINFSNPSFRPLSSTEASNLTYKRYSNGILNSPDKVTTEYSHYSSSLLLVRNLINIPADKIVGQEYDNTVIIYKNGTNGIGCAKEPVAKGAPIFMFGGNTNLGTTDGVGTGLANTNLMLAAITSNQAACNWRNFVPTFDFKLQKINVSATYISTSYTYYGIANKPSNLKYTNTTNVEQELSVAQFSDSANFTTFDFTNVWNMHVIPNLISNPPAIFTVIPLVINIGQSNNIISYYLDISLYNAPDYNIKITNTLTNEVLLNQSGTSGTVVINALNDVPLLFEPSVFGQPYVLGNKTHLYYKTPPIEETTIDISNKVILQQSGSINPLFTTLQARNVHGSLYYNGKVYGTVRNTPTGPTYYSAACIAIVNEDNSFELIEINYGPNYNPNIILTEFENICRIGTRLFALGRKNIFNSYSPSPTINTVLLMFDTITKDYKLFSIIANSTVPIYAVNDKLIINNGTLYYAYDPTPLYNVTEKYNLETSLDYFTNSLYYQSADYGGHIDYPMPGYEVSIKAVVHSIIHDSTTLYLAFTTISNSGYNATLNKSLCELHAVDIATMTHIGWSYIPMSTDDMTLINNHVILGVEVQPGANPLTLGYGKSIAVVNINELKSGNHNAAICMKPLHISDNPPTVQSYACLKFANYLFDFRTNCKIYVIDVTNIDTWSETDNIGKYTVKVLNFTSNNVPIIKPFNEGMLLPDNSIAGFMWGAPSEYARFIIPNLELFKTVGYLNGAKIIAAYINGDKITKIM